MKQFQNQSSINVLWSKFDTSKSYECEKKIPIKLLQKLLLLQINELNRTCVIDWLWLSNIKCLCACLSVSFRVQAQKKEKNQNRDF